MKTSFLKLFFVSVVLGSVAFAGARLQVREETVDLFDSHRLLISVPEGFTYTLNRATSGMAQVKLADAGDRVTLDIVFLPDPEEQFKNARARCELLNDEFREFVDNSSEKAMQFEELEPRFGLGTYCVFTDAKLIGKTELPAGEYLHLTAGLKAWPGVVAIFRVYSNDTTSADYQATMKLLRESVQEKLPPLR